MAAALDAAGHTAVVLLQAAEEVEVPHRLVDEIRNAVARLGNGGGPGFGEVGGNLHQFEELAGGFDVLRAPVPVPRIVPSAPGIGEDLSGFTAGKEREGIGGSVVEPLLHVHELDRALLDDHAILGVEGARALAVRVGLFERDSAALVLEA